MEENINKKNNIQVNALNVGTEKASSKYYSYQNDSTDIIQANTNKFNKNQENSLSSLFENTPYEIIDGSLFKVTNKKGNKVYQKLSNFVPYLKNETIIDDGVDVKRYLSMEGKHANGKNLPSIRISANDFNNMNWITKNWGLHCNIETGQTVKDCIRHAIQCTATNIKIEHIYCHTGWRNINNKLVFLCNGLYLDKNIETNVELEGKLSRYCLTDVLTVIDDYHPSTKLDELSMNKTAQVIMRSYGDRIGKNRLNYDSTLKVSKPPRGNAIITGESTPDISESGTARYISIELQPNDIEVSKLTELQELSRNGAFKSVMSFYIPLAEPVIITFFIFSSLNFLIF